MPKSEPIRRPFESIQCWTSSSDYIALREGVRQNPQADTPRLVLADFCAERGREDVADMWRGTLPKRDRTRKRIDKLTGAERSEMPGWAEKWTEISLSTDPADRPMWEAGAYWCYNAVGLAMPRVVWCPSPIVVREAAVTYQDATTVDRPEKDHDLPIISDIGSAISEVTASAIYSAATVRMVSEVNFSTSAVTTSDLASVLHSVISRDANPRVRLTSIPRVNAATVSAVRSAIGSEIDWSSLPSFELANWSRYNGGQFWSSLWLGPASVTFFLDRLRLRLWDDLERSIRAHVATCASACWWYPCREVVFVSERPYVCEKRRYKLDRVLWDGWGVE